MNDLFELNLLGKVLTYADDTALFIKAKNSIDCELAAKKDFTTVKNWFVANSLSCNTNKMVFMTFALSNVSLSKINTLENHSRTCFGKGNCESHCFRVSKS